MMGYTWDDGARFTSCWYTPGLSQISSIQMWVTLMSHPQDDSNLLIHLIWRQNSKWIRHDGKHMVQREWVYISMFISHSSFRLWSRLHYKQGNEEPPAGSICTLPE